jgi:hypothetical protein
VAIASPVAVFVPEDDEGDEGEDFDAGAEAGDDAAPVPVDADAVGNAGARGLKLTTAAMLATVAVMTMGARRI